MKVNAKYDGEIILRGGVVIAVTGTLEECIAYAEKLKVDQNVETLYFRRVDDE